MMPRRISSVPDGETLQLHGENNIITGPVGKNVKIVVRDGSLHVQGSVGANTSICIAESRPVSTITKLGVSVRGNTTIYITTQLNTAFGCVLIDGSVDESVEILGRGDVIIKGNVGSHAYINSANGSITAKGVRVGAELNAMHGGITCQDVASDAELTITNGHITCGKVSARAKLHTLNGNINVEAIAENATLTTVNGSINVSQVAHPDAKLETDNGSITVAGVTRPRPVTDTVQVMNIRSGSVVEVNGQTFYSVDRVENTRSELTCHIGCALL